MNVLIAWSAPSHCSVCRDSGRIAYRWFDGRLSGHGVMACPHSTDARTAIPIASLPIRQDVPRSAAA